MFPEWASSISSFPSVLFLPKSPPTGRARSPFLRISDLRSTSKLLENIWLYFTNYQESNISSIIREYRSVVVWTRSWTASRNLSWHSTNSSSKLHFFHACVNCGIWKGLYAERQSVLHVWLLKSFVWDKGRWTNDHWLFAVAKVNDLNFQIAINLQLNSQHHDPKMRNLPKQWRALRGLASQSSKNRTPRTQPEHQTTGPSKSNSASHSFGALGMDLNADIDEAQSTKRAVIESIGSNSFTISGVRVSGSVLIMPHISTIWNVDRFSQIQPPAFALIKLMNPRPDICIIGTGAQLLVCTCVLDPLKARFEYWRE